jgi:transposase-like protein
MSQKRKQYGVEFKAKVALEAVREEATVAQLAQKHGIHPTLINQWKRQLLDHAAEVFTRGAKEADDMASTVAELYRQIGQLKVECDFLASRSGVSRLKRGAR